MLSNDQVLNKGRYRIVNNFGDSGSGVSYEAYDTVSNTSVVLTETIGSKGKVTTFSQMEAINSAFLGGAKSLAEIRHESIVGVQDYFADIDRQYLVLEPVNGSSLSKFLSTDEGKPRLYTVLDWADKLLDAVHSLHTHSTPIIHGDIRPENVKITNDGSVKLLTSFAHTDDASGMVSLAPMLPADGGVNYRPLEQLWSGLDSLSQRLILKHYSEESERWLLKPLNAATDIYALGATVYAVVTGTPPPDALDRSIAAIENKPDPLSGLSNNDVPPEIAAAILKAMALRREDRFDSAVIFRQTLRTLTTLAKERETKEKGNVFFPPAVVSEPDILPAATATVIPAPADDNALRLEIKAEEERLEQERKELERRRLELDAKMERQKAEEERLNREAAEAQLKVERDKDAAEAELEKNRREAEQQQREEKAAREAFNTSISDDFDLLEVPSAPVRHSVHNTADTAREGDSQKFEAVFSGYEKETKARPAWMMPALAAGLLAVVIGGVGFWKLSSSNVPGPPPAAVMNNTPQMETQAPAVAAPTSAETTATEKPAVAVPETNEKTSLKPVQVAVAQEKPSAQEKPKKDQAAAPVKAPAAKKAVTVDDLINDH